jgi:hypothetical protein
LTKTQVWFDTDLGFQKTKDVLLKNRNRFSGDMQDWLGRLDFRLSAFKDVTFQITTKGKLGIYFPEDANYEPFLTMVKPFLVKADGAPAEKFIVTLVPSKPKDECTSEKKLPDIENTIKTLKFLLMRNPTLLEIAHKMDTTPEAIREPAFKLSSKTKWSEPSGKQCLEAEEKLKGIYELGSVFQRFGKSAAHSTPLSLIRESPTIIVERVGYALKNERDELPEIVVLSEDEKRIEFEFKWPRNSQWYLSYDYSQFYYKETGRMSVKMAPQVERVNEEFKKFLKEMKDSTKN